MDRDSVEPFLDRSAPSEGERTIESVRCQEHVAEVGVILARGGGPVFAKRVRAWCGRRGGEVVLWDPASCALERLSDGARVWLGVCSSEGTSRSAAVVEFSTRGWPTVVCSSAEHVEDRLEVAFNHAWRWSDAEQRVRDGGLWGSSPALVEARRRLALAALSPTMPVLLLGETGTGKWVAAKALHDAGSHGKHGAFTSVNCAGLTPELIGSELFGHVRGAFTGAKSARPGAFVTAGKGTILLDEIGELSPQLQAALLTTLQDRRFKPVGSDMERHVECRVVAATNRNLEEMVAEGRFRLDLLHRLDGIRVQLPPLRERREDVPELFRRLLARHGRPGVKVDSSVGEALRHFELVGNIRELEMVARRTALLLGSAPEVSTAHLLMALHVGSNTAQRGATVDEVAFQVRAGASLEDIARAAKRRAVEVALEDAQNQRCGTSRTEAVRAVAEKLAVSERTIYQHLAGG